MQRAHTYRDKDRNPLHLLIHSPDACNDQAGPGTWNPMMVSHTDILEASPTAS